MSWSQKRKLLIIIILLAFFTGLGLLAFWLFQPTPTCNDGIQNQNEQGIDCGGICTRVCEESVREPVILWARTSRVEAGGLWSALAYVQNSNLTASASNVNYRFRLYDNRDVLIYEKSGQTDIPANKDFAIFLPGIFTDKSIPSRTVFEFIGNINWVRSKPLQSYLTVTQKKVEAEGEAPKASATVANSSLYKINQIEAIIILYAANNNVVNFSRTIIDSIGGGESTDVFFTWREAFVDKPVRTEVLLRVLSQ